MQRSLPFIQTAIFNALLILFDLVLNKAKFLLLIMLAFIFLNCYNFDNPTDRPTNMFPYYLRIQKRIPHQSYFFDLDHNGDDEILNLGNINFEHKIPARIQILDKENTLIEQVNFNGRLQEPFALNWDNTGDDEIVIPYVRNDSLFMRILTWRGKKLADTCLLTAESFPERKKNYLWTGGVKALRWHDLDGDRKNEFIFFISEGYARSPRGIFVYDGKTFQLKWKHEIGPLIQDKPVISDVDNDGFLEIIFGSSASNNGHQKNGTDDQHSYLFCIDYRGQLKWRRIMGEQYSTVLTRHIDLDGNAEKELLTFFVNSRQQLPPTLEIINPINGTVIRSISLLIQQPSWAILNQDRDTPLEICIFNKDGKIVMIDHHLDVIFTTNLSITNGAIYACKDLDLDGRDEIFISSPLGTFSLDSDFEIRAKYSKTLVLTPEIQIFNERKTKPCIAFHDDLQYELVSLERNPSFFIIYYSRILGIILLGFAFFTLIFLAWWWYQRARFHKTIYEKVAATCQLPYFIIDHKSRLVEVNAPGLALLQIEKPKLPYPLPENFNANELHQFLKQLPESEALHQEKRINASTANAPQLLIIADPILIPGQKKSAWVVMVKMPDQGFNFNQAQTWVAMAQRVAHDLKNPLTSILLTLQRLQMEYRDQNQALANGYDRYTQKIIERIEILRRTSRQFMKFINIEKINLQPTHLNHLINDFLTNSIVIPQDILLVKKLASDIPSVHIDQEQMQSVLENLINNAINAMPDGGTLTISTNLVLDLQLKNKDESTRDYLLLEIMDTGIGIPDEIKRKLFQPYVSQTVTGTGLGLAIVKKVVDDHQGMIEFSSEEDVGTSFTIYLPLQK